MADSIGLKILMISIQDFSEVPNQPQNEEEEIVFLFEKKKKRISQLIIFL